MAAESEKNNNKALLIIIIIIGVLVVAGLATVITLLLVNKENEPAGNNNSVFSDGKFNYQQGIIAIDQKTLQEKYNEALQKTKDGYISLLFNNWAESEDGVNFKCSLGNSAKNKYDMYLDMYLDNTLSQRVFVTGLIPPGSAIKEFKSEVELEPGTYEAVLVLTQVDEDHSTIKAQTSVQITLQVKG